MSNMAGLERAFYPEPAQRSPISTLNGSRMQYRTGLSPAVELHEEYDFIVVGAGPAGCALTSRLSEDGKYTVLLLEAGGTESILNEIPLVSTLLGTTDYYWQYFFEKQDGLCQAYMNDRCSCGPGKGLGGGSLVNYMINARGSRNDYDKIAKAGNPGWSYDEVLPYFRKFEKASLNGYENTPYHGKNGPMHVQYGKFESKFGDAFLAAAVEMGEALGDYNKEDGLKFDKVQTFIDNGERQSAARAYLYPYRDRKNMHISTRSYVTKINIDPRTKIAESVEFARENKMYRVKARKEIVLSAGPLGSPKILMLSGVGPKTDLQELNIEVLKDLPVGKVYIDHFTYPGFVFYSDEKISENRLLEWTGYLLEWFIDRTNLASTAFGVNAIGFIDVGRNKNETNVISLVVSDESVPSAGSVGRIGIGLKEEFFEYYRPILGKRSFAISIVLLNPKSRGYVKLKDNNPFSWLKVYGNHMTEEDDAASLIAAIRYVKALSKTDALLKNGYKLYDQNVPGCDSFIYDSDDYWKCAIGMFGINFRHSTGTCKMGPEEDSYAVVDYELKVRGIERLRVADVGILPYGISGYPAATAYMIGEKAADLIKGDWKVKN